jgi:GntR family transcriptional repressor for pyruvate dehydrogenase complex
LTVVCLSDNLTGSLTQARILVKDNLKDMREELRPVQRISLSDGIVKQITAQIGSGALKPGERIPSEKELCRQFQVSRAPLREALRSLSVLGILESRAGEGTFVSADNRRYLERTLQWGMLLDRKAVQELMETRLMLETHVTYLAASRASEDDIDEIESALEGMEASVSDPQRYLEFDLKFHLLLARATQNSILRILLNTIRGYLEDWIRQALDASSGQKTNRRALLSVTQHRKILNAIKRRRPGEARRAMVEHILSSSGGIQAHLSSAGNGKAEAGSTRQEKRRGKTQVAAEQTRAGKHKLRS